MNHLLETAAECLAQAEALYKSGRTVDAMFWIDQAKSCLETIVRDSIRAERVASWN